MADAFGVTITFQGKPCLPLFSYTRDAGLEPGTGFVTMLREDFKDFVIKESIPGVDLPTKPGTQEKVQPPARGFISAGQLVLKESIPGDSQVHKVVWDQVLVTERGVQVAFADDSDENETCTVEITDIRYLYSTRGVVYGWVNVPVQGPPAEGTTDASAGPELLPGSLDNGKPWTVERVLRGKILPNLPGNPSLRIQKDRPAFFDNVVGPKLWTVVLAKEALAEVLEEFQLVFALNLDASVSIWARDTGGVRIDGGTGEIVTDTNDANCDSRVAESRKLVSYKHVPSVALVVGAPRIRGIRMRLEACGLIGGDNGKVVPLPQALAAIGLDMGRACKFAMLTKEERTAKLGVSEEGVKAFDRWAFKWYRLPGGEQENASKLPILDARAALGSAGELLPLRVFSEGHAIVRPLFLDKRSTAAGAVAKLPVKQRQLAEVEKQLREANDTGEDRKALEQLRDELKNEIKKLAEIALNVGAGPAFQKLASTQAAYDKAAAALEKAKNEHGLNSPEASALLPAASDALKALEAAQVEAKNADLASAFAKQKATQEQAKAALVEPTRKKNEAKAHFEAAVKAFGTTSPEAVEAQAEYTEALHSFNAATAAAQNKVDFFAVDLSGPTGKQADALQKKADELQAALDKLQDDFEAIAKTKGITSPEASAAAELIPPARQAAELAKSTASTAGKSRRAMADRAAEEVAKAAQDVRHLRVVVDVPFGEQAGSSFEIDADRGIVKFSDVQGRAIQSEAAPEEEKTLETCVLSEFAAVEIEFAYQVKPGPDEDIALDHKYNSVWLREGSGAQARVKHLASVPAGVAPLLIGPKPELQQFEAADGRTNKPFLDVLASRIAEGQLRVEQSTVGAVVDFGRPVPVITTGAALSVAWAVGIDERPRTSVHVSVFARLAPPSNRLRTKAYGGLTDPGSPAAGAIFLPKGLK